MTLPVGLVTLVNPNAVFSTFGLNLDTAGQLIARGYAATLIAFGLIIWLMRNNTDNNTLKIVVLAATVFNFIEAIIQANAGFNGIADSIIYGNVLIHGIVAILCTIVFFTISSKKAISNEK